MTPKLHLRFQHSYDTTTSIALNSDNCETNDSRESANTSVQADTVLNSNCLIVTDNGDSIDDSTSSDTTGRNDADLPDLPAKVSDHRTSPTALSRPNVSAGQWVFKGTNLSTLFMIFQQKVVDITTSALLDIESSIHEAPALSHVFLLAPQQHSPLVNDIFTEDILDVLTESLVHESLEL
ncbi:hypothetical protein DFQ28_005643 [Apophysomyces sp. BC1034]|nr:hypothetical protein DFQ30_005668 [Apophysomyces sp. BC1015]KAG0177635.1 hypothetical protein DFQ29_004624 [Apophysomyces sp. BC1021]KAG0187945.1 hypothetical protein DFQ28_005643 [Apophysomyces sp. BC1034]